MFGMRRREFITLLGGAASLPLAARAERGELMRRIGVLDTLAADDPEASVRHGAFMQGLQELGWAIGRKLRIDTRWAAGDTGRLKREEAIVMHNPFESWNLAEIRTRNE